MKTFISFFLILVSPLISKAIDNEFSYDKEVLNAEFIALNKASLLLDEKNVSYEQLINSPVFEENINLTNVISVKPNFSIDEMEWGSFAWGFCCWPIGVFTVLINDDKDKNHKDSFWAGMATVAIIGPVAYVVTLVALVTTTGGF